MIPQIRYGDILLARDTADDFSARYDLHQLRCRGRDARVRIIGKEARDRLKNVDLHSMLRSEGMEVWYTATI